MFSGIFDKKVCTYFYKNYEHFKECQKQQPFKFESLKRQKSKESTIPSTNDSFPH